MNPSFENVDIRYCDGQITALSQGVANPWRNGLRYGYNTIYRSECKPYSVNNGDTLYEIPWYAGYSYQYARTGIALVTTATSQDLGFGAGITLTSIYTRGKLNQSMVAGKHYYCGFYINFCNFESFICNNFGMYLSNDTLPQYQDMQVFDTSGYPQRSIHVIKKVIEKEQGVV